MIDTEFAAPCTTERYYLAEGCRWDEVTQELLWLDIASGRLFLSRAKGPHVEIIHTYHLDHGPSAVAPLTDRDEGWLVATSAGLVHLTRHGESRLVGEAFDAEVNPNLRTNDGCADPWGLFWVGSMSFDETVAAGSIYRFDETRGATTVFTDVTIPNGIGWSPDHHTMFVVDSGPGLIRAFDVDDVGQPSRGRVLVRFNVETEGAPDGLCVDAEGCFWVAIWGGGEVRRYTPTGQLIGRVHVETSQPSCCTIGGENQTTLYITTAQEGMSASRLNSQPRAGQLFCAEVGVRGLDLNPFSPSQRLDWHTLAPIQLGLD